MRNQETATIAGRPPVVAGYNSHGRIFHSERYMIDQHIEAVFADGVFRPLQPVHLPENQHVTLVVPAEENVADEGVGYQPLPLRECQTIRVRIKHVGDFGPLPYPVAADALEEG
jgi:predicted DNA-binding antitoxin AbrB/MazE fold protein